MTEEKTTGHKSDLAVTPADVPPVSRGRKMAFGVGAVADQIGTGGPSAMAAPLLNISLGMDPWTVGLILGLVRIWDAVANPIMGAISDNSTSRFGRRRPFIVGGAVVSGLTFFLMWCLPRGWSLHEYVIFFSFAFFLFYTAFTVFSVPYHALGYELTTSYHERTRVMAYRMFFNIIGLVAVGWLFPATQWTGFRDAFEGMFWVGTAGGILIAVAGTATGILSREAHKRASPHVRINAWASLRYSFQNRSFFQVACIAFLALMAGAVFSSLSLYVNIYYVNHGQVAEASLVQGVAVTAGLILTFLSIPVWTAVGRRIGKIALLRIGGAMIAIGSVLQFFVFDPASSWLQLVAYAFVNPGSIAVWLPVHAMVGDICDSDELQTGARREGMYGAIISLIQKVGISFSVVMVGALLSWSGFDKTLGGAQSPITLLILRASFVIIPAVAALAIIFIIGRYRLTEQEVIRMQAALAARRAPAGPVGG